MVGKKDVAFLIKFCADYPRTYNRISNILNKEFGIGGAEICLLLTYFIVKYGNGGKE